MIFGRLTDNTFLLHIGDNITPAQFIPHLIRQLPSSSTFTRVETDQLPIELERILHTRIAHGHHMKHIDDNTYVVNREQLHHIIADGESLKPMFA